MVPRSCPRRCHRDAHRTRCLHPGLTVVLLMVSLQTGVAGSDLPTGSSEPEPATGTIAGRVIFEGTVPPPRLLARKDEKSGCGKFGVYDESLLVHPESRGIANVLVWLMRAPDAVKLQGESNRPSADEPRDAAIEKCQFSPRVRILRTGAPLRLSARDNDVLHNVQALPFRNPHSPYLVSPSRYWIEFQFKKAEPVPIPVRCNYHRWERGYWLVLDHSVAAKTDSNGRFSLSGAPRGEFAYRVWHERVGFIEKKLKVNLDVQKLDLDPIVIHADDLAD